MKDNFVSTSETLASRAFQLSGFAAKDLERFCWMAVHEHRHGVLPSEYDIREIDEDLYLLVLEKAQKMKT